MENKIIAIEWAGERSSEIQFLTRIDGQCTKLCYESVDKCMNDMIGNGYFTTDDFCDYFDWMASRD